MAREATLTSDKDIKEVVRLRQNEGLKWSDIAERLGVSEGKAMFAYMVGTAPKIKNPTAAAVAKARADGESWGLIAARTGLSEGKVRAMFTEATGTEWLGQRIGKGGAYPGQGNGHAATATTKKAAKATKAPAKKAAASGGGKLRDLVVSGQATLEQVQKGLAGKQIRVLRGNKEEVIGVAEVTGLNGSVIKVKDSDTGRSRAVKAETIVGVR